MICVSTHMILSAGRDDVMAEITSVRHDLTFSVMPSLSIMIIWISISHCFDNGSSRTHVGTSVDEGFRTVDQPARVARPCRLELRCGSVTASSPPAMRSDVFRSAVDRSTHWIPTSGFGFRPCFFVSSTRFSQLSVGMDRKPEEISRTSKPRFLHVVRYFEMIWGEPAEVDRTRSMKPPVET